MIRRTVTARLLAAIVIAALPAAGFPARAESGTARLSGAIRSSAGKPLAGVRLLAADPARGEVHRSEPTTPEGGFTLPGLEPGTYDLAVEVDGGVYLVTEPLYLVAGVERSVRISLGEGREGEGEAVAVGDSAPDATPSLWNNPLSAGALVLGVAIVVGVLVENFTEDETSATRVTTD